MGTAPVSSSSSLDPARRTAARQSAAADVVRISPITSANSRSSAHPQQDTTVVSLASLTSFVCLSQGDYVCVFGVCTQKTPPCSCMTCTASVVRRIYAARC